MTSRANGEPVSYEVRLSAQIRDAIRQVHQQAVAQGRGQQILAALRLIHERLRTAPEQFGEPLYHLPALRLLVFQAIISPIVVDYGVHQERPLVLLRGVKLLD
jgi:hypothetical protein